MGHFYQGYWSKVIRDVATVVWPVNPSEMPVSIVNRSILTDQITCSADMPRHAIRMAISKIFR